MRRRGEDMPTSGFNSVILLDLQHDTTFEYASQMDELRQGETHLVTWPDDLQSRPVQTVLVDLAVADTYRGNAGLIDTLSTQSMMHSINMRSERVACDRAILPPPDMTDKLLAADAGLRAIGLPEALPPAAVGAVDIIGYSVVNSGDLQQLMQAIELSGLNVLRDERAADDALVVVGGHAAYNPLLLSPFADIVVVGDGEDALLSIAECVADCKGMPRSVLAREIALRNIPGVFVAEYPQEVSPTVIDYAKGAADGYSYIAGSVIIRERQVDDGPIKVGSLLLARSCVHACSFCQMSASNPYQTKPFDELTAMIDRYAEAGVERVFLTSAIASAYHDKRAGRGITDVLKYIQAKGMKPFYSSDRPEKIDGVFSADNSSGERRAVMAPETSPRLRRAVLGKTIREETLRAAADAAVENGVDTIELFTIMGIPGETAEDRAYPLELAAHITDKARAVGRRVLVEVGIAPLLPALFSQFENAAVVPYESYTDHVAAMRQSCAESMPDVSVRTVFNSPGDYYAEVMTKRGDESVGELAAQAYSISRNTGRPYTAVLMEMSADPSAQQSLGEIAWPAYRDYVRALPGKRAGRLVLQANPSA